MLLSLVYINCDYLQAQTTIPRFEEGERVVFVGNSITHGGHYHSFIWLYYMTRFPDKPITIMNAGIGGESAWDMKDRLDYDVFNRKPTYVTLTFGMNDTGYDIYMKGDAKELSEQRIAKSLESYQEIEERLLAKNKIKKVLIGGSPYDETSRFNNFILHNKNNAILKIIDAQRTSAKKNGWGFVDFNQPMREICRKEQEADSTFTFCRIDRIHPDNDDFDDVEEKAVKTAPKQASAPKQTASAPSKVTVKQERAERQTRPAASSKITPMRSSRKSNQGPNMEVCVIKPSSMEDTREIADTLVDNSTVILNLEGIDVELAQRIIDFTSGACYSLGGSLQKVSSYIFVLGPYNVDITGDLQNILGGSAPSVRAGY